MGLAAVAGCGGDGGQLTQEPAASPSTLTTADGPSTDRPEAVFADDFEVDDPQFEAALRSFYGEYLASVDAHRTPDEFILEYGSGLEALASPTVVAGYAAWRAANEAHGDGFQRVAGVQSLAYVTGIEVDGARVTIEDCTNEIRTMVSGQEVSAYVTRVVQVANEGGLYRVVAEEVVHEGMIDSPGYGCVPAAMAENASEATEAMLAGLRGAQADPRGGLPAASAAVLAEPLESELVGSLAEQAAEGASFTSPTEVALTVEGIDPRGLGLVVVVSACVTYPEGLVQRDLSGVDVREVFAPGTRQEVVVAVRMNELDGPVVFMIVSEAVPTSC